MEDVTLAYAKEHFEVLVARAARGEEVRISDSRIGTVKLTAIPSNAARSDRPKRMPGRLQSILPEPPAGFFDPLSDEELKDWYGDDTAP